MSLMSSGPWAAGQAHFFLWAPGLARIAAYSPEMQPRYLLLGKG